MGPNTIERRHTRPRFVTNELQDGVYDRAERAALITRLAAFWNCDPEEPARKLDQAVAEWTALGYTAAQMYASIDQAIDEAIEADDREVFRRVQLLR